MTQPSLFDLDPAPAGLPDAGAPRRMARRSDPETSHDAAVQAVASGTVARDRDKILNAMRGQAWLTSEEIARLAGIDRVAAARRMKELEADRLIVRGPARKSTASGRAGVTWRLM